MDKVKKKRLS